MTQLYIYIKNRLAEHDGERGATAVEYGLLVALIAVFIIGAVTAVGGKLGGTFQGVADALP
jgi:pilus assembly protein Flp/PilA